MLGLLGGSGTDLAGGYVHEDRSVEVVIDGLDVGSTARLTTPDGTVVGETEVSAGSRTTVTVPGPDNVLLVLLGLDGGVPVSELVQTPQPFHDRRRAEGQPVRAPR